MLLFEVEKLTSIKKPRTVHVLWFVSRNIPSTKVEEHDYPYSSCVIFIFDHLNQLRLITSCA